jgi:hypothetical protein
VFFISLAPYTFRVLTDQEILLTDAPSSPPPRSVDLSQTLQKLAFWCIILNIAVAAVVVGLVLRRYAWDQTEPIRFIADIDNAFVQGTLTLRDGYVARYTNQTSTDDEYDFDYAPGRLAVATIWTRWVRRTVNPEDKEYAHEWPNSFYREARSTGDQYKLCRPLLILNSVGEIISAIAMFLLVRQWTSGQSKPGIFCWPQQRPMRSAILGLIAALFFWFNIALIWNAHCWPQWDSWVLPFVLWALVLASADYWLCAGILIAAGAMFKAQILFGAPFFILWPLFRGHWLAIVRWIIGVLAGSAVMTACWLMRVEDHLSGHALLWVIGMGASIGLLWWALKKTSVRVIQYSLAAGALLLVMWPLLRMGWVWIGCSLLALGGLALLIRYGQPKAIRYATAGWIGAALFACVPIFGGSMTWFHVGITYGTHRYSEMVRGSDNNLAAILNAQWQWNLTDPAFTIPPGHVADWLRPKLESDPQAKFVPNQPLDVPIRHLLFSVYVLAIVLCSIGAAIHSKRGSPRFLVAVAAPWIMFFAVLPQMHQRYLLWGSAISAATVALGPGFALLHLLITVIAWSQEAVDMLGRNGYRDSFIFNMIQGWHPGIGWALLLCAAIFVYIAATPERKRR